MKKQEIIRAWRDPKYRRGLRPEQASHLPAHPAGRMMSVEDDVLASVTGGCCGPATKSTQPMFCSAYCSPCPPRQCY